MIVPKVCMGLMDLMGPATFLTRADLLSDLVNRVSLSDVFSASSVGPIRCMPFDCEGNLVPQLNAPGVDFFITSGPGPVSGTYLLVANSSRDQVKGTMTISSGLLASTSVSFGFVASTSFDVEVSLLNPLVTPPVSVTDIPVLVRATGSVACASDRPGAAFAIASFDIATNPGTPVKAMCPGGASGFSEDTTAMFPENTPELVVTSVQGGIADTAGLFSTVTDSFNALMDPTFEIDPSFPYASYFKLEYSPGFSQQAVPEPDYFLVLGGLLSALGVCRWKRRLKQ